MSSGLNPDASRLSFDGAIDNTEVGSRSDKNALTAEYDVN